MDRLPLVDQFPYQFYEPRIIRFWTAAGRLYNTTMLLRREQKVVAIEIHGQEHLKLLLGRGDGILIAPNHPDSADPAVLFETSGRLGRPFMYLAAYQLFRGLARYLLPRIGCFPIDREGADTRAMKRAIKILEAGKDPLVIFPEGEIYHTCDRLTPLRDGAVALASSAARRVVESGRTVWIVPVAVKYRFVEGVDPMPALERAMGRLEARFTWWPRSHWPIVARIYAYAEGLLGLKELEYLGQPRTGPLKERICTLRDAILDRVEDATGGKRRVDAVPVRVKEGRRACLEALAKAGVEPEAADRLRRDLNDLFVALQLFSYPGDYVRQDPTLERIAETIHKFEQDTMGAEHASPVANRRAIVRFGEPIDVGKRLAELGKPRVANPLITAELAERMQRLLDVTGPGRPIVDRPPSPSVFGPRVMVSS